MWFITLQVTFLLMVAACLFLILKKVRRIDTQVWNLKHQLDEALTRQYGQIEALSALNQLLHTTYPLPPTRGWAGSPDFLLAVAQHTLSNKPETIVECSSGTSTIVLARCAQLNGKGHVYSLENDIAFANKTRERLQAQGLASYATVINAPLTPLSIDGETFSWYGCDVLQMESIDMLVIDGPPAHTMATARYPAGPMLFGKLTPGATVFLDDAYRVGEREIVLRWVMAHPTLQVEEIHCEKGLVKIIA